MPHASAVDIRKGLGHPVVDADAHVIETPFVYHDYLKEVGGVEIADRIINGGAAAHRTLFWAVPSGKHTIDRATVMLPRLYRERLESAGIDFAIVYTTLGIGTLMNPVDELRRVTARALNMMYADMFRDVQDRLTPAAVIPTFTPAEAIAELEFAVNTLGFKAAAISAEARRPIPGATRNPAPAVPYYVDSLTIDSPHDFDPFWAKCVELKIAPSAHSGAQGAARHCSPTNYVYNRLGDFGVAGEHLCRSLFLGGVTRRFPQLKFAFLEGGVGYAIQLYNALFEIWEKRNVDNLLAEMDPAKLDIELMAAMYRKYGDARFSEERYRAQPHIRQSRLDENRATLDDFAACGITSKQDIYDMFVPRFYFGCEADDRVNAMAFNTKLNHFGAKLNAIFSSDIGHWDVVDMTGVLPEAWELVEEDLMSAEDFRRFVFSNTVEMHTALNPDFFKGTAVESDVARHLA
jgi:predicted TIM-barrel fold metal-dependent hydrolase